MMLWFIQMGIFFRINVLMAWVAPAQIKYSWCLKILPTETQLAIQELGSLVSGQSRRWLVTSWRLRTVALHDGDSWDCHRCKSIGNHVTWTKMALFQRFWPSSPRFTLQTAIEFPKRDVEFEGIIESCLLAVDSDPFVSGPRLVYFVNSKCTAWKQLICCNGPGVERICFFLLPVNAQKTELLAKYTDFSQLLRGGWMPKGCSLCRHFDRTTIRNPNGECWLPSQI